MKFQKPILKIGKKGQVTFGSLPSLIITLGIVVVIGAIMAILLTTLRDDQTGNNSAWNVSENTLSLYDNLTNQFGLLGTDVCLVLVVSVVIAAFRFRISGGL